MDFESKVAIVTGAQQGIGAACATALGGEGAKVLVNYLDDGGAAQALCLSIGDAGAEAIAVEADISKPEHVAQLFERARELGGADVLINNAGIFPRVGFLEMSEADWDAVLDVNLRGAFLCTQAAARQMAAHGRGGTVVNLSSSAAHSGPALGVHYAASKAGLIGFTRAAAVALAPHRIRVNAVAPGLTDTAQPRYGMTEAEIAEAAGRLPLGRIATPPDIAACILFLASDRSRHVTGQVLHVNGGQLFP